MLINLSLGFKTALGSHTSLEHSKLSHKPRILNGNPPPQAPSRTPPSSFGPCTLHLQDVRLSAERPCPDIDLTSGCQVIGQVKK